MILYGADLSSPSNKVRFVANALGVAYEYRRVNLRQGEQRKPEFLKLNPAGKIPVIDDDGFILFESNAIMKYLAYQTKSPVYPQDRRDRVRVDQWIDFVSFHVGMAMNRVVFNRLFAPMIPVPVDEQSLSDGLKFLERYLPVVDQQLSQQEFLVFSYRTLADFNLLAVLDPVEAVGVSLDPYASLRAWREKEQSQDFYQKCHESFPEALQNVMGSQAA